MASVFRTSGSASPSSGRRATRTSRDGRIRRGGQRVEQPEGRAVGPLQIVQEEHERVLPRGEQAHEGLKREMEAGFGLDRADRRKRGRRSHEPLELGRKIGDHARVVPEGVLDALAPRGRFGCRPAQQLDDQRPECLRKGRIRRAPPLGIELGGEEAAASRGDRGAQVGRQGRLADPGRASQHHDPGFARGRLFPGEKQRPSLVLALIKPFGQRQFLRQVDQPELEGRDEAVLLELRLRRTQVLEQRLGALITRLGHLGQKAQDDLRKHAGHRRIGLGGRHRRARQVRVDQLNRIGVHEGRAAGEHLVEDRAQRIEIRALIDQAVHAPGLFRCNVGKLSVEPGRYPHLRAPATEGRRGLEVDQGCVLVLVEHHVPGIDVAVDDVPPVQPDQHLGQLRRDGEKALGRYLPAVQPLLQILWPGVLQDQGRLACHRLERDRPHDARYIEAGEQVVFLLEPRSGRRVRMVPSERLDDDGATRLGGLGAAHHVAAAPMDLPDHGASMLVALRSFNETLRAGKNQGGHPDDSARARAARRSRDARPAKWLPPVAHPRPGDQRRSQQCQQPQAPGTARPGPGHGAGGAGGFGGVVAEGGRILRAAAATRSAGARVAAAADPTLPPGAPNAAAARPGAAATGAAAAAPAGRPVLPPVPPVGGVTSASGVAAPASVLGAASLGDARIAGGGALKPGGGVYVPPGATTVSAMRILVGM